MPGRETRPKQSSLRWVYRFDSHCLMTIVRGVARVMRFHILRACILALLCAPSVAAWAELKIGYVNAVEVIEKAPQGEAALKKLEAEFSPRDKKIVDMQNK